MGPDKNLGNAARQIVVKHYAKLSICIPRHPVELPEYYQPAARLLIRDKRKDIAASEPVRCR